MSCALKVVDVAFDYSCGSVPLWIFHNSMLQLLHQHSYSSTGFLTSESLSAHIACGMRGDPNEDRNYVRCKIILKICKPSHIAPQEPAPSTGTPGRAWELLCCLWFPVGEWGWALSDQLEKWITEKTRKASHAASTEGRAWDFHLKLLPASVLVGKMW